MCGLLWRRPVAQISTNMKIKEFFGKLYRPVVVFNCLGMMLVTLLLGIGAYFGLDLYTNHGDDIEMPDLYGVNLDVATKKMEALGLRLEVVGKACRSQMPENAIVLQSVVKGGLVKKGRVIEVHVNTLNPIVKIPEGVVGNCPRLEAEAILTNLGFRLTPPEYVVGETRDWVLQIKAAGKVVKPGTPVSVKTPLTIVLSDGTTQETYNGSDSIYYDAFFMDPADPTYQEEVGYEEAEPELEEPVMDHEEE